MTEDKENISFIEFKAWLTGLIRGKNGEIPNLDDWKQIKLMMDKVNDNEPQYIPPMITEHTPLMSPWYTSPQPWCTTSMSPLIGDSMMPSIGDLNVDLPELKDPSLGDHQHIGDISTSNIKTNIEFNDAFAMLLNVITDKNNGC